MSVRLLLRLTVSLALLSAFALAAPSRSIDLTSYGLQGATNPDYKPRVYTTAMDYLADGTLVVAFPVPVDSLDIHHERTVGMQRDIVLHLNPQTGEVLHRFEARISNDIRALSATPDGGFMLVEGRHVIFYNAACEQVEDYSVPDNVMGLEISPSRKFFTEAAGSSSVANLRIFDTTTRNLLRQHDNAALPVAVLGDGYAHLERYSDTLPMSSVSRIESSQTTGYRLQYANRQSEPFDLGLSMDCPITFEPVHDEAIAFASCGTTLVIDGAGHRVLKDRVPHGVPLSFLAAMKTDRIAYSYVIGAKLSSGAQLRAANAEMGVRVADLKTRRVVSTVQMPSPPKVGGAFALSPDGHEIAVLTDKGVEFTAIP